MTAPMGAGFFPRPQQRPDPFRRVPRPTLPIGQPPPPVQLPRRLPELPGMPGGGQHAMPIGNPGLPGMPGPGMPARPPRTLPIGRPEGGVGSISGAGGAPRGPLSGPGFPLDRLVQLARLRLRLGGGGQQLPIQRPQ